jgi:hypothetical protein
MNSLGAQDKNSKLVELELVPNSLQTVRLANCSNTPLLTSTEWAVQGAGSPLGWLGSIMTDSCYEILSLLSIASLAVSML